MSEHMKDAVLGTVLAIVGLFALFYIQYGPGEAIQSSRAANITFRSFPFAISALLFLISSLYVISSLLALSRSRKEVVEDQKEADADIEPPADKTAAPSHSSLRILAVLAMLIGFALLLGKVPFFLLTGVFLFIAFFIFGEKRILLNALVAAIGGGLFHILFVSILNLPLY
ncbi:tripartite tricarboxylate transporter TctB family protein [Sneathiella sp.]|uniref:tripartite tricarboxylate transporter TctB family protein n=1 Tax=Sneathiella sp. TaxID=1964365 RepID=UPI003562C364